MNFVWKPIFFYFWKFRCLYRVNWNFIFYVSKVTEMVWLDYNMYTWGIQQLWQKLSYWNMHRTTEASIKWWIIISVQTLTDKITQYEKSSTGTPPHPFQLIVSGPAPHKNTTFIYCNCAKPGIEPRTSRSLGKWLTNLATRPPLMGEVEDSNLPH